MDVSLPAYGILAYREIGNLASLGSTYLMQERKFHHIRKALTLSRLINVLHWQDTPGIVREVNLGLDPTVRRLSSITNGVLFILVLRNLHVGYIAARLQQLGRNPRILGILEEDESSFFLFFPTHVGTADGVYG
jgi:hypothetical protein